MNKKRTSAMPGNINTWQVCVELIGACLSIVTAHQRKTLETWCVTKKTTRN